MNLRRVLGWAAVFCALLVYVVFFERAAPEQQDAPVQEAPAARLIPCTAEQLRELLITGGTRSIRLIRKAGGWETDPAGMRTITPELVASLITALLDTTRLETVAEQPESLDQFGLTAPSAQITILLEGRSDPLVVRLGGNAPSQVSMYAQLEHERSVVLIGTYLAFSIKTFLDNAGLR